MNPQPWPRRRPSALPGTAHGLADFPGGVGRTDGRLAWLGCVRLGRAVARVGPGVGGLVVLRIGAVVGTWVGATDDGVVGRSGLALGSGVPLCRVAGGTVAGARPGWEGAGLRDQSGVTPARLTPKATPSATAIMAAPRPISQAVARA